MKCFQGEQHFDWLWGVWHSDGGCGVAWWWREDPDADVPKKNLNYLNNQKLNYEKPDYKCAKTTWTNLMLSIDTYSMAFLTVSTEGMTVRIWHWTWQNLETKYWREVIGEWRQLRGKTQVTNMTELGFWSVVFWTAPFKPCSHLLKVACSCSKTSLCVCL